MFSCRKVLCVVLKAIASVCLCKQSGCFEIWPNENDLLIYYMVCFFLELCSAYRPVDGPLKQRPKSSSDRANERDGDEDGEKCLNVK